MAKLKYHTPKVFYLSEMPEEIKKATFDIYQEYKTHNDSYIEFYIDEKYHEEDYEKAKEFEILRKWFLACGATKKDKKIVIKYSW